MVDTIGNRGPTNMVECIQQKIYISDFTDDAGTAGHVDLTPTLPPGSLVLGWGARIITGFTGDTTALMSLGISGELDVYTSAATDPSCYTGAGTIIGIASLSNGTDGTQTVSGSAVTLRVNVVGGADFTSITAGEADIFVYYIQLVPAKLGNS